MIALIITLAGLLVVVIISNAIFFRLLKKSLKSQSYYHSLFRREQRECLQSEIERKMLETEMQDMIETITELKKDSILKFKIASSEEKFYAYEIKPNDLVVIENQIMSVKESYPLSDSDWWVLIFSDNRIWHGDNKTRFIKVKEQTNANL